MRTGIWRDSLRRRADMSLSNMLGGGLVDIVRVNGCDCTAGYRTWTSEARLRLYLPFV